MFKLDYSNKIKVHFMGIGGISMSGLAEILHDRGFTISGSDREPSEITKNLESKGIKIFYGQKAENITDDIDLLVYTAAISSDNPELIAAKEKGIEIIPRAELLGQIMKNYDIPVAISGTHGKTTTTSMLTTVLLKAEKDPTISVGGILDAIGGNLRIGNSPVFVTEACEYSNSFLSFFPKVSIILNIEEDHLDFFKDINDIRNSFKIFADLLPEDGLLVISADIDNYEEITKDVKCPVITFGKSDKSDIKAKDISFNEFGHGNFTAVLKDGREINIALSVPGIHNVYNALSVIAVSDFMGISEKDIKDGLSDFHGADRRFQYKGKIGNVTIIDDYAHHPTEIMATLNAAKNYPHRKLYVVFQPHTYTRTKAFFEEFQDALSLADEVIFAEIYAAREKNTLGISSKDLMDGMVKKGNKAHFFETFSEIEDFILQNLQDDDLLITMGAGDVYKVGDELLGK